MFISRHGLSLICVKPHNQIFSSDSVVYRLVYHPATCASPFLSSTFNLFPHQPNRSFAYSTHVCVPTTLPLLPSTCVGVASFGFCVPYRTNEEIKHLDLLFWSSTAVSFLTVKQMSKEDFRIWVNSLRLSLSVLSAFEHLKRALAFCGTGPFRFSSSARHTGIAGAIFVLHIPHATPWPQWLSCMQKSRASLPFSSSRFSCSHFLSPEGGRGGEDTHLLSRRMLTAL